MKNKKTILSLLSIIIIGAGLILTGCGGDDKAKIGDPVEVNGIEYVVEAKQIDKAIKAEEGGMSDITSDDQFVVLDVKYKNTSDEDRAVAETMLSLVVDDRTYQANQSQAMFAYGVDAIMGYDELKPDEEKTAKILFEVPEEDANHEDLQAAFKPTVDDENSAFVFINLD